MSTDISLPIKSKILTAKMINNVITVIAQVDKDESFGLSFVQFRVYRTGDEVPNHLQYLTTIRNNLHVYYI